MILYFDGVQVIRLIINYQLLITNAVDDEMLCSLWERGAPAPRNCILFFTTKDTKGAINYELRITNYECRG